MTPSRRHPRVAVVLWLGLFGYLGGGVLCDVHCEAELADNADFALAAGVVASAEPSIGAVGRIRGVGVGGGWGPGPGEGMSSVGDQDSARL
jgi:hypothetical protein